MKHLSRLAALTVGLLLSLNLMAADLIDPAPIAVPSNLTSAQVSTEIKRAMINRGWAVAKEQPGVIDATLSIRSHRAQVKITHDRSQVVITYVSSENLDYKEKKGKRLIHRNYNSWVNNLVSDISKNLQMTTIQ